jgi:flagellar hook-length control protein FliK
MAMMASTTPGMAKPDLSYWDRPCRIVDSVAILMVVLQRFGGLGCKPCATTGRHPGFRPQVLQAAISVRSRFLQKTSTPRSAATCQSLSPNLTDAMLLSTVSLDTSPAQDLPSDPAAGAASPPETGADSFASQLAQALDGLPQGQNLAAGAGLKTLQLGPGLEVITAGADQPDAESLAAFAAAQGLDPDVVAWLFGKGKPGLGRGDQAEGEAKDGTGSPLDAALQAGMSGLLAPVPGTAGAQGLLAAAPADTTATGPGAGGLAAAPAGVTLAGLALGSAPGWLPRQGNGLLPSDAAAVAQATADAASAESALAASQALVRSGAAFQVLAPAAAAKAGATGPTPSSMPVEILALDIEAGLEALLAGKNEPTPDEAPSAATASGASQPPALSAAAGGSAGAGSTATTATGAQAAQPGGLQHRADALHDLAQRLGEAVGQRVLGQIARGQWSMKLLLKPSTLGEVEVDLRMRAGELDAAFRTLHPLTRDLLADGLPRLREVLSSAGMDIAGLHVGHGSSQGSGGNPTPRQAMGTGERPASADGAIIGPAAVTGAAGPRRSGSANWDVLV